MSTLPPFPSKGPAEASVHLLHLALLLVLVHQNPHQARTEHRLVVDPRVYLAKQARAVPPRAAQQLGLAARVEGQVRRDVVDAAPEGGPRVLAAAARLPAQHAGRDAQIRRCRGQPAQVGRRRR